MPITATQMPGAFGRGTSIPAGGMGEERFELTHDGASTSVAITTRRGRAVKGVIGSDATVAVSGQVATLTWAAAKTNGAKQHVKLLITAGR